ncbi:DUF829 domain-containing protein [Campylobacter sp. RM3125]|uniref:DUF829 domain-containing protein n=1 Tax=Campylobacter molothri TaxID=1032242 RepID=UPI00301D31B5|nr:DUF829 domain-containing protein [Campylobacter sp. RM3125]MBZ7971993.1 DUF829 domain-containing protein [Campylobacter sp. RM3124]
MNRDVFYIAGYDPKSYRYYYDLFKKNLKKYSDQFDIQASIGKVEHHKTFPFFKVESQNIKLKYHFLTWNDIVKKNWSESYLDALKDCYSFFRIYTITGLFIKFGKESIYQLITGYYPFFYVILSLIFSLFIGFESFFLTKNYIHFSLSIILGFLLSFLIFHFLFKLGRKLAVFWIARICAFCANWHNKKQELMQERIKIFSDTILQNLKQNKNNENYELILVAHSVGTIVCIEVLDFILKQNLEQKIFNKLKIITLGECIPLVSYQKKSNDFRKKLEFISQFDLKWYDYTSVIDGACFPQVDFFRTSGVNAKFKPHFLSAKFHTLYEKNEYKKIKKDKNKAHFLYLYSPSIKGSYDFFSFVLSSEFLEKEIKV